MRYLGPEGLAALKDLIKKALDGKANKTHTHEKSEIGDYVDYELPVASDETLGGVKIGEGLEIDEDGVLNTAIKELEWDKVQNKPTKVSEFENDAGYINSIPENYVTKEYLDALELVSEIPEEYITEKELSEKGFLTEVPSFYITDNELKEKGYITHYTETDPVFQGSPSFKITDADIANWNKIANEHNIPTKVSELENDREFISKTDTNSSVWGRLHVYDRHNNWGDNVDLATGRIQGVNLGGSPDTLYLNLNSSENVEILHNGTGKLYYHRREVATQEYVDKKVSDAVIDSDNIDLTDYAKKEELPSKLSQLENDSGYVTNTDYASSDNAGLVKTESYYGLHTSSRNGTLYCEQFSYDEYTNDKDDNCFIGKGTLENVLEAKDYAPKEYVDEKIENIEVSGGYSLPIASSETLGGIKVGANLTIDENGTLNATASSTGDGSVMVDTVPIGTVILYDGEEIPDGYEEVENYEPTYSLEEQVVGTWIDGRPIYRKVIVTTTPSTANSWIDVPIGTDNIKEYISYSARFEISGLTYFADIFEDSTHKFMAVAKSDAIAMMVGTSSWGSKPVTLIIEYTKTTD